MYEPPSEVCAPGVAEVKAGRQAWGGAGRYGRKLKASLELVLQSCDVMMNHYSVDSGIEVHLNHQTPRKIEKHSTPKPEGFLILRIYR